MTNLIFTAYCACSVCCGPSAQGITANGNKPTQGITVAANFLPLGTKIQWNNRTYIVQDRMARRFTNRVDVYFSSHKDAKQFGIKRNQSITVIPKRQPILVDDPGVDRESN